MPKISLASYLHSESNDVAQFLSHRLALNGHGTSCSLQEKLAKQIPKKCARKRIDEIGKKCDKEKVSPSERETDKNKARSRYQSHRTATYRRRFVIVSNDFAARGRTIDTSPTNAANLCRFIWWPLRGVRRSMWLPLRVFEQSRLLAC